MYERATFTVNKGTAVISFSNENSAALGSEIELVGNLKPQLAKQTISLKITNQHPDRRTTTLIFPKFCYLLKYRQINEHLGSWPTKSHFR